jgi:flagellar motor switch protein FliM
MSDSDESWNAGRPSLRSLGRDSPRGVRRLDLTGRERQLRGAMQAMGHVAQRFARAARRALPFLVKRRVRIVPGSVAIIDLGANSVVDPGPLYEVIFEAPDGPAWGCLTVNPEGLMLILEGALGGGDGKSSQLGPDLTLAQAALVSKVMKVLAEEFKQVVQQEAGIVLNIAFAHTVAQGDEREATFTDGLSVDCRFDGITGNPIATITISAEALESAARENTPTSVPVGDPRMAEALCDVPVDVVAELGRVKLGLKRVLSLEPGQVIRLETAVDDPVLVRIAGIEKFIGVPVVSRGQLAIEIRGRHEA